MQSDRASRMMLTITEWCVGPALAAAPRANRELEWEIGRPTSPSTLSGPVETAATLRQLHRFGWRRSGS